jgi:hypothetical protein
MLTAQCKYSVRKQHNVWNLALFMETCMYQELLFAEKYWYL